MIILDTNVVSESMKPEPNLAVRKWLNEQPAESLYLTTVTLAELMFGIGVLPGGRRKKALGKMLEGILGLFGERVLPFDVGAAHCYAELAAKARAMGKGFPLPDGYIAAIAVSRGFIVATRDTSPFEAVALATTNPWFPNS
jgi:predicted nucleic acid-binding protein